MNTYCLACKKDTKNIDSKVIKLKIIEKWCYQDLQ